MEMEKIELLQKEIAYRASRRGTKELDAFFKPFTDRTWLASLPEERLESIKATLLCTENDLMHWFVEDKNVPIEHAFINDLLHQYR